MTDILLCIIVVTLVIRAVQAKIQHKELINWLDSIGDQSGDQRREIINQLKKAGK